MIRIVLLALVAGVLVSCGGEHACAASTPPTPTPALRQLPGRPIPTSRLDGPVPHTWPTRTPPLMAPATRPVLDGDDDC